MTEGEAHTAKTGATCDGTSDFAFYVPNLVPLPNHLAVVDPPSVRWHCSGDRLGPAGVVACRRGLGRSIVCIDARLHCFADRDSAVIRLDDRVLLPPLQR